MNKVRLGIIGGSGIYDIEGVEDSKWEKVSTPFGDPSDKIFTGKLNQIEIAFLPRHGRGHVHSPSSVPYMANICALKMLGVTDIIVLSACGSLRDDFKPGEFILIDQFIDRTFKREKTFFSRGCVAHVSVAKPVCNRLSLISKTAMDHLNIKHHLGGTYLTMEGPQFSTRAESLLYKESWKCDVIGMTNMPEAKLAREAEICYCSLAMVTDYDCWHPHHDNVEVTDIIETLTKNSSTAKTLVKKFTEILNSNKEPCSDGCDTALEHAIISDRSKVTFEEKNILKHIAGRILK